MSGQTASFNSKFPRFLTLLFSGSWRFLLRGGGDGCEGLLCSRPVCEKWEMLIAHWSSSLGGDWMACEYGASARRSGWVGELQFLLDSHWFSSSVVLNKMPPDAYPLDL